MVKVQVFILSILHILAILSSSIAFRPAHRVHRTFRHSSIDIEQEVRLPCVDFALTDDDVNDWLSVRRARTAQCHDRIHTSRERVTICCIHIESKPVSKVVLTYPGQEVIDRQQYRVAMSAEEDPPRSKGRTKNTHS